MPNKDRDSFIIKELSNMEKEWSILTNKKIKIHVKNNHWAPGSFPTDAEGEKNFTITKERFDNVLNKFPEIKEKNRSFFDWDEENFKKSISNSDILLAWNFPTKNLKEQAPNLKWIHVISAGVEHLLPLDWMSDDLVLTNSSGAHAKKAGEFGLMSILMLQNHMTRLITHQKKIKNLFHYLAIQFMEKQ